MKHFDQPWISLDAFERDPAIQPRPFLSRDAVRRYALVYREGPDGMPPIRLGRLPDNRLKLIDGFHRVAAAEQVGQMRLRAEIIPTTEAVLPWLAVDANIRNGVPIPRRQKREVFRRFIEAGQNRMPDGSPMSSRAIAKALPIGSHTAILTWIKSDFPALYREMAGGAEDDEEPIGDGGDQMRDQALADVAWAEGQLTAAIAKALKHVEAADVATSLTLALRDFEKALGRPLVTLDEALDTIHDRRTEVEDDY